MRFSSRVSRPLAIAALAFAVAGVSGCKWFHKGNPDYLLSEEARPLEIPPDLTPPSTAGAMQLPPAAQSQPAAAGTTAPAAVASATGFTVGGGRDEVFAKVGEALGTIDGVTISSSAQLLGSYDVTYGNVNFLIRIVAVDTGSYVSAVDPRGLPASGEAPARLIAALKEKLGG